VETGRHVVLIDTGAGPGGRSSGAILARLEVAGIRPRNVDTVILTHAHPDHIGGTVGAGNRPVFTNARHVLSEYEWEFWTRANPDLTAMRVPHEIRDGIGLVAKRSMETLRFQIETVDRERKSCRESGYFRRRAIRRGIWRS
jgi:glyoxylase-like metal-dependent hydrolase (beta-lactamase superfamily II)